MEMKTLCNGWILLFLMIHSQIATAIKCYSCHVSKNAAYSNCYNFPMLENIIDCNGNCYASIKSSPNNQLDIERGCDNEHPDHSNHANPFRVSFVSQTSAFSHENDNRYVCAKDFCNAINRLTKTNDDTLIINGVLVVPGIGMNAAKRLNLTFTLHILWLFIVVVGVRFW